jgi:hypothetical protein
MRVIDVTNACVVYLPAGAEFVTLFYKWGSAHDCFCRFKSNINLIEEPGSLEKIVLPVTVRDTIMV